MIHRYFPHTADDISEMLKTCGASRLEDLYSDVPDELVFKRDYALPEGLSEHEVRQFFAGLASANRQLACFAGNGFYDHYSPAVIPALLSRSEFLTAYTPYQPEISQGTLQYIFEYQSMMSELTGLPVCNASMYDGATATAEAMMMAVAAGRKKNRVLISSTLNPAVRAVVDTYAKYHGITLETIGQTDGITSRADLSEKLGNDVAGVIVQTPNRYGIIEDFTGMSDEIHNAKALLIMNVNPSTLAVLRSPAEWGADVAVGDGQSLGIPLSFGGPYIGFMCTTQALMRKIPGRIVGSTTDESGQRVFVLTLQAREQHIRRDKATSNICSNQSLMALYVTIYMALAGTDGLRRVNEISCATAHELCRQLEDSGKMRLKFPDRPFLNEMAMSVTFNIDDYLARCAEIGILGGVKADESTLLIAATETSSRTDIDRLVALVKTL